MAKTFVLRWRCWIAPRPVLPGIFRRRDGGFLVRARLLDPRTGQRVEFKITMDQPGVTAVEAARVREAEIQRIRLGQPKIKNEKVTFAGFAVSLLEKKLAVGEIRSAKSREKWGWMLEQHLIPRFGRLYVSELRRQDVDDFRMDLARLVRRGEISPRTANDRLSTLRTIINQAVIEFELERNPVQRLALLDVKDFPTYSDEQPNSLTVEEVQKFLAAMRRLYPQHFGMTVLGFATGLRPSSLRPLRRGGPTPDLLLEAGVLLIRRSHTRKQETMNSTKQGTRYKISLPQDLVEVLRWHITTLTTEPEEASELLFPSITGGFRSASVLDGPFRAVAKDIGLRKHITPRAMRRTAQDLNRAAEVNALVTRAVSGHATEAMQGHYSTVGQDEIRASLAKVINLAKVREIMAAGAPQGAHEGARDAGNRKAG